jgi:SAM-dependent methyltransferase
MGSDPGAKAPWKVRLRAWWDGVDLPAAAPVSAPATGAVAPELAPMDPRIPPLQEWETDDIRIQQQVWGQGYCRPGGDEHVLGLAKPFALNPSLTVMEFGSGLGGGTRALVNEFGVWVNGLEPIGKLARAAKEMSIRAGLEKKADVIRFDPEGYEPKPSSVDCILSSETLYLIEDKLKLLKTFERCLKPRGQLSLTDFVRRDDLAADDPQLAGLGPEPDTPAYFASGADYVRWLRELNFDLRVNEDITERYRKMIMDGWVDFTQAGGERAAHARAMPESVVKEVELWTRRVAAIDAGALKVMRYYAIKLGGSKLMSNW